MRRRGKSTILPAIACLTLVLVFAPRLLWSQLTTATISGTVTDTAGAVIPDADGHDCQPGHKRAGFNEDKLSRKLRAGWAFQWERIRSRLVNRALTPTPRRTSALQATAVYTVSPVLSVGTVSNRVEVSAAGVQVQTSTPEISTSVSQQEVETLPLNGRNFQSLSALMPGVTNTRPIQLRCKAGFCR